MAAITKIEYKKTYNFNLTPFQVGSIPTEELVELFMDGRVASKFLEIHIPIWFPNFQFVDAKGYDFIDKVTGEKVDQKAFTRRGANYAPSGMIGVGRKVDLKEFVAHAENTTYCFTDITQFPKIKICFWAGAELLRMFGSNKIGYGQRSKLFP